MKDDNPLTKDNVFHVLLAFFALFLVANAIQALYGAVNLMVIGWYCTLVNVTAMSIGTQVTQVITSVVSGLILDGMILVGKCISMKDEERTCCTIGTTLSIFTVVALMLTVGMLVFRDAMLVASKTPATSTGKARQYMTVCFCGVLFICGYNAINAILWGYGDSRRPMYSVAMFCVLNIMDDVAFAKYLGSGVTGTTPATVLSQSISMVCSIVYLNRKGFIFTSTLKNLRIDRDRLKKLVMMGIPISSQECMVRLSFLYLTSVTNRLGVNAAVAVGIASKYDIFAVLPAISIASALVVIMAQSHGTGEPRRVRRSLTVGIGFAILASSIFSLWAQLSSQTMIGLFNINPDVIETGVPFLHSCSSDYLAAPFALCLNGPMNGRSKTVFTMVSCCFGALAPRMPLIRSAYTYCPGNLFITGPIAPTVSGFMVVYTILFVIQQPRQNNNGHRKELTLRSV